MWLRRFPWPINTEKCWVPAKSRDAQLTEKTKMGYDAQKLGNSDFRHVFSGKSLWYVGPEASKCCPVEWQRALEA
jgi:hypothetical protein